MKYCCDCRYYLDHTDAKIQKSIRYSRTLVHWDDAVNKNCRVIYTIHDTPTRRLYIMGDPEKLNEFNDCLYYEEAKWGKEPRN